MWPDVQVGVGGAKKTDQDGRLEEWISGVGFPVCQLFRLRHIAGKLTRVFRGRWVFEGILVDRRVPAWLKRRLFFCFGSFWWGKMDYAQRWMISVTVFFHNCMYDGTRDLRNYSAFLYDCLFVFFFCRFKRFCVLICETAVNYHN